jgi:hypothetical protein
MIDCLTVRFTAGYGRWELHISDGTLGEIIKYFLIFSRWVLKRHFSSAAKFPDFFLSHILVLFFFIPVFLIIDNSLDLGHRHIWKYGSFLSVPRSVVKWSFHTGIQGSLHGSSIAMLKPPRIVVLMNFWLKIIFT